jgi:pimeloyl-ACP methyl ester carboxylesterase
MSIRNLIVFSLLSAACSEPVLEPIDDNVALFSDAIRVRGDAFVQTDVYVPLGLDAAAPAVVMVQGGAVAADRYSWLGKRLAASGFVAIHPYHTADLAFFSAGNAGDALSTVRQLSESESHPLSGRVSTARASIMGHSLGGVVASGAWLDRPDLFEHLVLLASYPDPAADLSRDSIDGDRVVAIVGGQDPSVTVEQSADGIAGISATQTVAIVEGVSHYQFVDEPSADELEDDGTPAVELQVAHDRIYFLVDALLRNPAALDDPSGWPEGVVAP